MLTTHGVTRAGCIHVALYQSLPLCYDWYFQPHTTYKCINVQSPQRRERRDKRIMKGSDRWFREYTKIIALWQSSESSSRLFRPVSLPLIKKKKILLSQSHFCTWNSHPFKEWHRTMQRSGHRAVAYRDEGSEATAQQHTALKIIQINKSVTRELLFQWQSRTKQVLVLWLPDYPQCLTHSSLPGSVFSPAWLLPTPTCPCIY